MQIFSKLNPTLSTGVSLVGPPAIWYELTKAFVSVTVNTESLLLLSDCVSVTVLRDLPCTSWPNSAGLQLSKLFWINRSLTLGLFAPPPVPIVTESVELKLQDSAAMVPRPKVVEQFNPVVTMMEGVAVEGGATRDWPTELIASSTNITVRIAIFFI